MAVGGPIPFAALPTLPERQALADHLKVLTYALASAFPQPALSCPVPVGGRHRVPAPIGALKRRMSNGKRAVTRRMAERLRQPRPR